MTKKCDGGDISCPLSSTQPYPYLGWSSGSRIDKVTAHGTKDLHIRDLGPLTTRAKGYSIQKKV